jgi:hypothetical protein
MGTITVNVEDKVEKRFREVASTVFGKRKGYLGKALTIAMQTWTEEKRKTAELRAFDMLKTGLNLGGIKYKKRKELHERKSHV